MSCTGGIGWLGACKVGGHTLPFRSAQASEEVQMITLPGIGGRNNRYYSKYMEGKHSYKASASFQLFSSHSDAIQWLLNKATGVCTFSSSDGTFKFCPAGKTVYTLPASGGTAAIESLSLSCTAGDGNGVQGSVSVVSTKYDMDDSGLASSFNYESAGNTDDGDFLPWYFADITCSGLEDASLINNYAVEFSLNIRNDIFQRYGLCTSDTEKRNPVAIRYGMLDVTGSLKYWSPDGSFAEEARKNFSLTIDLTDFTIRLSNVTRTSDVVPSGGANSPVFREIQFRALADCDGGAPITVS